MRARGGGRGHASTEQAHSAERSNRSRATRKCSSGEAAAPPAAAPLAAAPPTTAVAPLLQMQARRFPGTSDTNRWEVEEEPPAAWLPGTLESGDPRGILAALSGQQRALDSLPLPGYHPTHPLDEIDEIDETDEAEEAEEAEEAKAEAEAQEAPRSGRASGRASGLASERASPPRAWEDLGGSGRASPTLVAWEALENLERSRRADLEQVSRSRLDLHPREARVR